MVLNTRGHTNYEVDFEQLFDKQSANHSPSAAYMHYENNIFSVFASGDQVAFYQGTTYVNTIRLESGDEAIGLFPEENSVLVICKSNNGLKTFRISMESYTSEVLSELSDSLPVSY